MHLILAFIINLTLMSQVKFVLIAGHHAHGPEEGKRLTMKNTNVYSNTKFMCKLDALCIEATLVGNNVTDCPDGSDEPMPGHARFEIHCPAYEYECSQSGICIPMRWFNNTFVDCPLQEDEDVDRLCAELQGRPRASTTTKGGGTAVDGLSAIRKDLEREPTIGDVLGPFSTRLPNTLPISDHPNGAVDFGCSAYLQSFIFLGLILLYR